MSSEPATSNIAIIGAGVIGLSTAVSILEACPRRVSATIVADKLTPDTLSDGAMGIFEPVFLGDDNKEKIRRWADETFQHMVKLATSSESTAAGTFLVSGYSIFRDVIPDPFWRDVVINFRHMSQSELSLYPGHKHGWSYTSAITECRLYLPHLMKRFTDLGGKIEQKKVESFSELHGYDTIINCSGLGARELCNDEAITACSGQVHRVQAPWIKHFLNADDDDLYILPGQDYVVLGGTHDIDSWSRDINKHTQHRILTGCAKLVPSIQKAELIKSWIGLRPLRKEIRLEKEILAIGGGRSVQVIHNYGHGGSGITLHWGCAKQVVRLLNISDT